MKIYAVMNDRNSVEDYFSTPEKATQWLYNRREEVRYKFGVHDVEITDTSLSWIMGGWLEQSVKFTVKEIEVK